MKTAHGMSHCNYREMRRCGECFRREAGREFEGGKETFGCLGERALRWINLCEFLIWWPTEMPARTRN